MKNKKKDPARCLIKVRHDPGVDFWREYLEELKEKYDRLHFVELGPILFGNITENQRIPAISEGFPIFRDHTHISSEFSHQKIHLFIGELHRQKLL